MRATTLNLETPLFPCEIIYMNARPFADVYVELERRYPSGYTAYEYDAASTDLFAGWEEGRAFKTTDKSGDNALFWLWTKESDGQGNVDIGFLAHECYHLAIEILRHSGVIESPDSEELYAYMLAWIVAEIVGHLWKVYEEAPSVEGDRE